MRFIDVDLKLNGMRKIQNFTVYPCLKDDVEISIQSDNRFCRINLESGLIVQSQPKNYANSISLMEMFKPLKYVLDIETLEKLKIAKDRMAGLTNSDRSINLF